MWVLRLLEGPRIIRFVQLHTKTLNLAEKVETGLSDWSKMVDKGVGVEHRESGIRHDIGYDEGG